MKKILCPTDFSQVADYAMNAAIRLCKALNAELHLFHCTEFSDYWEEKIDEDKLYGSLKYTVSNLVNEKMAHRELAVQAHGISVETHISSGHFIDNIYELTQAIAFDFIVIGSHGASGKREWFFGSNTQKVVRKLDVNVLVVKNPLAEINFSKVVFATNLLPQDKPALQTLLQLVPVLGIETIEIVYIQTGSIFSPPHIVIQEAIKDFSALVRGINCTTHYYADISVDAGVRHFVEQHDTNLVVVANHLRQPLPRMLKGNTIEIMVNHLEIPILSIV